METPTRNVPGRLALLLALGLGSAACCCLEELTVSPQASVIGEKVIASLPVTFKFGRCLTSAEQRLAEQVKTQLADAFSKLVEKKVTEDQYNSLIEAARRTLHEVIYRTGLSGAGFGGQSEAANVAALTTLSDKLASALSR